MTAEDNNKQDSLSDLYGIRFGGGNEYGHDNNKEEVVEESITLEADEEVNRYFGSQDNEYKQVNKDEDKEPSDRNGKIQSAADVLVEVATDNAKSLFKDQYGTAYAQVHIIDHDEIIKVESNKLKGNRKPSTRPSSCQVL
jgi:hypothetical protein